MGLVHKQFAAPEVVKPLSHLKRLFALLAVMDFQAAAMRVR
jgi:hypothetical protein